MLKAMLSDEFGRIFDCAVPHLVPYKEGNVLFNLEVLSKFAVARMLTQQIWGLFVVCWLYLSVLLSVAYYMQVVV